MIPPPTPYPSTGTPVPGSPESARRYAGQPDEPTSRWSLRSSSLGSFALGVLALLLLVAIAMALLSGCPAPPPQTDCTPQTTRCSADGARAQVCSAERRWFAVSERPCSSAGADVVCCLAPSAYPARPPLHACVPRDRCLPEPATPATTTEAP